jgi:hypothetical protein
VLLADGSYRKTARMREKALRIVPLHRNIDPHLCSGISVECIEHPPDRVGPIGTDLPSEWGYRPGVIDGAPLERHREQDGRRKSMEVGGVGISTLTLRAFRHEAASRAGQWGSIPRIPSAPQFQKGLREELLQMHP